MEMTVVNIVCVWLSSVQIYEEPLMSQDNLVLGMSPWKQDLCFLKFYFLSLCLFLPTWNQILMVAAHLFLQHISRQFHLQKIFNCKLGRD